MERLTAAQVRDMLARRYAQPEWAMFFEVRSSTGLNSQVRSADAVSAVQAAGIDRGCSGAEQVAKDARQLAERIESRLAMLKTESKEAQS